MSPDQVDAIAALLAGAETAHGVYERTELNGVYDQDWPRWYAGYAIEHGIEELLGREGTADSFARFLLVTYDEYRRTQSEPDEPWAAYTARRILAELW